MIGILVLLLTYKRWKGLKIERISIMIIKVS